MSFPRPDVRLLDAWGDAAATPEYPYIATRQAHGKKLVYLGAAHENGLNSRTFKAIRHMFNTHAPQAVVFEGVPSDQGPSPAWYLDYARQESSTGFKKSGEPAYTALLAAERGIDFIPADPNDAMCLEYLTAQGYTRQDIASHYAYLTLRNLAQNNQHDDPTLQPESIQTLLNYMGKCYGYADTYPFTDFEKWHRHHMQADFDLDHIATFPIAPSKAPDATIVDRILYDEGPSREPHIVGVIADQLARPDVTTLAIVYGEGHHRKQRRMLDTWMGPPTYDKLPF